MIPVSKGRKTTQIMALPFTNTFWTVAFQKIPIYLTDQMRSMIWNYRQLFQFTFRGHHAYVWNRLDEESTMASLLVRYTSQFKSKRQTISIEYRHFIFDDLCSRKKKSKQQVQKLVQKYCWCLGSVIEYFFDFYPSQFWRKLMFLPKNPLFKKKSTFVCLH